MTKTTRRGLFGLGIGALLAPLAKHLPTAATPTIPKLGTPHLPAYTVCLNGVKVLGQEGNYYSVQYEMVVNATS